MFARFKIQCPGYKIPVRKEAHPKGHVVRYLQSGTVVEVFLKTTSGFHELSDKSVRSQTMGMFSCTKPYLKLLLFLHLGIY